MIKLYTIDCPKCKILEEKLTDAHISFEVCRDRATMMTMGLDFLPALDIDGTILNFKESIDWVRKQA
jgi:hypothetical protein